MFLMLVIFMSVVGACMNSAGLLLQKQGVMLAGTDRLQYLRHPRWLWGLTIMAAGWGMYLFSMAKAPLIVIQPLQGTGIVFFVIFSLVVLKERMQVREWLSVGALMAGVVLLAAGSDYQKPDNATSGSRLALFSVVILAFGAGSLLSVLKKGRRDLNTDFVYGAASGLFMGLAAVYTKAMLLQARGTGAHSPLLLVLYLVIVAGLNLAGLLLMQKGFELGKAVIIVTLQTALTGAVPVAGGILVLSERIASGFTGVEQAAGIILTVAGTMLLGRFGAGVVAQNTNPQGSQPCRSPDPLPFQNVRG